MFVRHVGRRAVGFFLAGAAASLSVGSAACGDGSSPRAEHADDRDASPDAETSSTPSLRFRLLGTRAVGNGSAGTNVMSFGRIMEAPGQVQPFAIGEDGSVLPLLDGAEHLNVRPVLFAARLPDPGGALVALEWPLRRTGESDGEHFGSLFHVGADGTYEHILETGGRIPVRKKDILNAKLDEGFQSLPRYLRDPRGRFYFAWTPNASDDGVSHRVIRYDPSLRETEPVVEAPAGRRYTIEDFHLSGDGETLVVFAVDDAAAGTMPEPDDRHVVRRYSLGAAGGAPIDLLPSARRDARVLGVQISDDGSSVFMNGARMEGMDGVVRADVAADGAVTYSHLLDTAFRFAPTNYSNGTEMIDGGFFDEEVDTMTGVVELRWNERWFQGGDRTSGALDGDAIVAHVSRYFTTEVGFADGLLRGDAALAAFLAREPYTWLQIHGVDATAPIPRPDRNKPFHLENHFVNAAGDPPTPVERLVDATGLAVHTNELRIGNIYLDDSRALWSLVFSHHSDELGFERVRPLRIVDAGGTRAVTVPTTLGSYAPRAWRIDRLGRYVYFAHDEGSGKHRLFRIAARSPEAEAEDMFVNAGPPLTLRDFSVGERALYFVGHDGTTDRSGWIDLETLAFTPLEAGTTLSTLEEL